MSRRFASVASFFFFVLSFLASPPVRGEVILQYFETDWDEIYRRMPEIGEIGYNGIWVPPPTKSPHAGGQFAGGGNVGYSHFDKFDLGDIPQRGSFGTRYGTRNALRNMVDSAHRADIRIYPDIVMNHFGNGPDYRTYPGTRVNDFHGWFDGGQPGGYKRAIRMNAYDDINNGFGYTFQQELVSLIDLQTESDGRFSSGYSTFAGRPFFNRQPGKAEYYPYGVSTNEDTLAFINRWIAWLGNAMDYDGIRMDAPKHVIREFFGKPGSGFNHEVQVNYDFRIGQTNLGSYADLYLNNLKRKDALIFSEFFIGGTDQVDYWRNWDGIGVKMRYLDFPRKSSMKNGVFTGSGNLGELKNINSYSFSPAEGVMFCQSHDEDPPNKLDLAYAYILTHDGLPVVYFTGNNLAGTNVNVKTWLKTGHGGALGDYGNGMLPNLVYINNQFGRGIATNRWAEGDFVAYERYDDVITVNGFPDANEGLMLVALNDGGYSQTKGPIQTAFPPGTVLHDYTGNQAADVTVNGSGQVTITVPAGSIYPVPGGQSWVCYAPLNAGANGDPLRFSSGGNPAGSMTWIVPGGYLTTNKTRQVTRITNDTVDIDVYSSNPSGGFVDSVIVKWGDGQRVNGTQPWITNTQSLVSNGFQPAVSNVGFWRLTASLTNVAEGLHIVKGRCFNNRPAGYPAIYQTFSEAVYVDRHGPDLNVLFPTEGQTVDGDIVALVTNADRTAYDVEYSVDGGGYVDATEIQKGQWKFNVTGLSAGPHTLRVRAFEADWGNPRTVINTSMLERAVTVDTAGPAVSLGYSENQTITLPFFTTTISAPGLNQGQVKLYWDGYELAGVTGTGTLSHVFEGRYISGGVTDRLWGAFVNGPHFFEAVAVNGGLTNRASRRVIFNLYGSNQVDSDGDGLPDNLEMPFFDGGTQPGPNVPWPGDTSGSGNQDMIPNYGESWSRLNPMNADTDYDGQWDGDEDSDNNIGSGDGVANLCEVIKGYLVTNNIYFYGIYNGSQKPADCDYGGGNNPIQPQISWAPTNPKRCTGDTLTVTYSPNQGPLSNAVPVMIAIGTNANSAYHTNMTSIATNPAQYQHVFAIPANATNITFWFHNGATNVFDNNGGANYNVGVGDCVIATNYFVMDGNFDSTSGYEIASSGMKILAAVKSNNLYVATWSANGSDTGDDHFVYVTDQFGAPEAAPWGKTGRVFFSKSTKPYLAAESKTSGGYNNFNNGGGGGRSAMGSNGNALEGELNLLDVFGYVPDTLYIAAVAMGDADGGVIDSECPPLFGNSGLDLEITEFQPVRVASIRDENLDGVFDGGKPVMETVVDNNTNNANYNIRRFFIDEVAGETRSITVRLTLNGPGGTNVVSNVELFSNLNRRDFAVLPGDEDPSTVTPASQTTYYRAYPMAGSGNGPYTVTLPVEKCGAYRINARYKVNGKQYYFTDNALRRDCAVVVSPKKALKVNMYELNPMTAEASSDAFVGRSTFRDIHQINTNKLDTLNTNYFKQLGVNMLWLQPIHPIGFENRETDPSTGSAYDPGSPYAVRNYWKVNSVLGDPSTESNALNEFTGFVQAMDANDIGVMLDGTFNHSAWDCEVGDVAIDHFGWSWATNGSAYIRAVRPSWYSKKGGYGQPASYFNTSSDNDIGTAPDRFDFGKWNDVADFFFGTYDTLVQGQTDEWRDRYLLEQDRFDGFSTNATRELWEYFAYYPTYWLEKTGHPVGTPKAQSYKGIDGLRCDFAQGLPSLFWEYCINKTRSVKWDFLFMAESLDGYREVGGDKRHGLSFRSARHFDIMNENLVFYWRDQFFDYAPFGGTPFAGAQPFTTPTYQAFDNRRNAYDLSPILLNLTGHDELLPHDAQWRVIYAYATLAAIDGAPMMYAGQEAGLQNTATVYTNRGINPLNNFARYEVNFGKGIPQFKRYNHLTNVWNLVGNGWKLSMRDTYQRINTARKNSTALKSQQNYFLSLTNGTGYDPNMLAVAKFSQPGVSVASQEVVLCFINNNYEASTNRFGAFSLNATFGANNWFGLNPTGKYNIVDLLSTTPTNYIWSPNKAGSELINTGIVVILNGSPFEGKQAQFLKLVDVANALPDNDGDGIADLDDPDDDNDGLSDQWEQTYNLNPNIGTGTNGPSFDNDNDGLNNGDEQVAGTNPNDPNSVLEVADIDITNGQSRVQWDSVSNKNYRVQRAQQIDGVPTWQQVFFGTAFTTNELISDAATGTETARFYRVQVAP